MPVETFILFKIADATYAARSDLVQQVQMIEHITRVPNAPRFVEGVVAARGKAIPVINLRKRFGMEPVERTLRSRLIVIKINDRAVGLEVDSAREFVKIDRELILPPPEGLTEPGVRYLEGVASLDNRLVLIVNLPELLDSQEKQALVEDTETDL